ncbi:uncharacterized protein [Anolis sagrei]|uniref:uncharacterized protein n=1 Tax=Anolis sagrei TaxID=38937 RepID=UPI003521DF99
MLAKKATTQRRSTRLQAQRQDTAHPTKPHGKSKTQPTKVSQVVKLPPALEKDRKVILAIMEAWTTRKGSLKRHRPVVGDISLKSDSHESKKRMKSIEKEERSQEEDSTRILGELVLGFDSDGRPTSRRTVAPWMEKVAWVISNSEAPETMRAYREAVAKFFLFKATMGYNRGWPALEDEVLHYLVHHKKEGLDPDTLRTHSDGISFFSKIMGLADPGACFRVKTILKSWKRSTRGSHTGTNTKRAITYRQLTDLVRQLKTICHSKAEAYLFRAAFTVAFFGALKTSQLVADSKTDVSGRALRLEDISLRDNTVAIKTRDWGGRWVVVQVGRLAQGELCPYYVLQKFLKVRGAGPGPLLVHQDGTPLTRYQFWAVFRMALERLGLPASEFGKHSFSMGAAQGGWPVGITARMHTPPGQMPGHGLMTSGQFGWSSGGSRALGW